MKNDDGDNKNKNIELAGSLNLVAFLCTHNGALGWKKQESGSTFIYRRDDFNFSLHLFFYKQNPITFLS